MNTPSSRRIVHELPAYVAGTLPPRRHAAVEARLATDAALRAECDRLSALAAVMRTHDPAAAIDPAATARLKQHLRAELPRRHAPARLAWRPVVAAAAMFVAGLLAGARLFPREVVREVVTERRVAVAVPVPVARPVAVEKVVEKRVEVPVERVVTRWRTRTVTRTVVAHDGPARTTTQVAATPAAPREVVELPVDAGRPSPVNVAVVPAAARAAVVDF